MGQTGKLFSTLPISLQLIGEENLCAYFDTGEVIDMTFRMNLNTHNTNNLHRYLNIKEDNTERGVQTMSVLFGSFFDKDKLGKNELSIMKSLYGLEQETLIMDAGLDEKNIDDMKERSMNGRILYSTMTEQFMNSILMTSMNNERKTNALKEWNNTFGQIYKGQLLDYEYMDKKKITLEEYVDMITPLTAKFIQLAAYLGSIVSGQNNRTVEAVKKYGLDFGRAFQIRDDYNDMEKDLREGKYRIFVCDEALNLLSNSEKKVISAIYPQDPEKTIALIKNSSIPDFVRKQNKKYIDESLQDILRADDGIYKSRLIDFAESMRI